MNNSEHPSIKRAPLSDLIKEDAIKRTQTTYWVPINEPKIPDIPGMFKPSEMVFVRAVIENGAGNWKAEKKEVLMEKFGLTKRLFQKMLHNGVIALLFVKIKGEDVTWVIVNPILWRGSLTTADSLLFDDLSDLA